MAFMCDALAALSPEHLRLYISTLWQFARRADTRIAPSAAESLLWGVSDETARGGPRAGVQRVVDAPSA
jgi:hypothetical protein